MPLIRKFAIQGHAVPLTAHSPRGPFPTELYAQPRAEEEYEHGDSLHVDFDDMRLFRCRDCGSVLYEAELNNHDCEEF